MYQLKLSAILGPDLTKECKGFIEDLKETRHIKVMEWQKEKFERLQYRKQQRGKKYEKSGCSKQVQKQSVPKTSSG